MANQAVAPSLPAVPPEVLDFAATQGVADHLGAVLEFTRRLLPRRRLRALLVDDPEIEIYRHIAIEVQAGRRQADELVALRRQWTQGLLEICTPPQASPSC